MFSHFRYEHVTISEDFGPFLDRLRKFVEHVQQRSDLSYGATLPAQIHLVLALDDSSIPSELQL